MAQPVLQIIIGSTRPGRVGPAVAAWIMPVLDSVNIPFIREKLDEDGRLKPNEIMEQAAAAMLDELARWAQALRPLRAGPTTP